MIQVNILLSILAIVLVMITLSILESYLRRVFPPHNLRVSPLYQGGESISSHSRGYNMENINLTMFFLILHVVGFFGGSLFILSELEINPFNWSVMGFGAVILFTVGYIAKTTR